MTRLLWWLRILTKEFLKFLSLVLGKNDTVNKPLLVTIYNPSIRGNYLNDLLCRGLFKIYISHGFPRSAREQIFKHLWVRSENTWLCTLRNRYFRTKDILGMSLQAFVFIDLSATSMGLIFLHYTRTPILGGFVLY